MNLHRLLRKIRYHASAILPYRTPVPSCDPVDVVIPVTDKDLTILPLTLEGLRRNVTNRIAAIYIVARDTAAVREVCTRYGTVFIDELQIMGYGPGHLGLIVSQPPVDRSGWLYQQLLKLSGRIGDSRWIVTIDSDHILLRPHTFVCADGKSVLYRSSERHTPYYDNIRRLIGLEVTSPLSYVAHKMVFDRNGLKRLQADIEKANPGRKWDEAILDSIDRSHISGFSEFELYGNWLPKQSRIVRPWRNHHLDYSHIADNRTLERRYGLVFAAVTFPSYLN